MYCSSPSARNTLSFFPTLGVPDDVVFLLGGGQHCAIVTNNVAFIIRESDTLDILMSKSNKELESVSSIKTEAHLSIDHQIAALPAELDPQQTFGVSQGGQQSAFSRVILLVPSQRVYFVLQVVHPAHCHSTLLGPK